MTNASGTNSLLRLMFQNLLSGVNPPSCLSFSQNILSPLFIPPVHCPIQSSLNTVRSSLCSLSTWNTPSRPSEWPHILSNNIVTTCTTLTVGALIIFTLTMIPRRFWQTAPHTPKTPDSSVPNSLQDERFDKALQKQQLWARRRKSRYIGLTGVTVLLALILILSLGLTLGRAHKRNADSDGLIVDLGYSKYQGRNPQNGVNEWLGIRYAAPPVGDLRFAAPQDPVQNSTVQKANTVCFFVRINS